MQAAVSGIVQLPFACSFIRPGGNYIMRPLGRVVAFDTAHPEQSVPGRLLSLLGFWNRPAAQQNGLNKQRAAAAGQRATGSVTLVQVGQINGGAAELASCTQGPGQHWRCSQRPQRQSVRQTLRSLIPTLPCALALALFPLH